MARSALFLRVLSDLRLAASCSQQQVSLAQGFEQRELGRLQLPRRDLIRTLGAGAILAGAPRTVWAAPEKSTLDVAIVGGGLAGLVCGDELRKAGVPALIYEASDRTGGRCWSRRDLMPGQVIERGGELIDNLHKTMIAYAKEFGCTLEDMNKVPGDVLYYFGGKSYPESDVVREYRAFVETIRADLSKLSNGPTALAHNDYDRLVDNTSLTEYLDGKNAKGLKIGPVGRAAIVHAYEAEFGLAAEEQSALCLLLFIHADRRNRFQPWGVFSDERYHIVEGNDRIAQGLSQRLADRIQLDHALVRISKTAAGRIELTLKQGARTITKSHDKVVVTLPFSVLRNIELDASLGLTPAKVAAIKNLGYGSNAKLMLGFKSHPWKAIGSAGSSYSDQPNHQTTWQTNPTKATATSAVITDYSSGARGKRLVNKNEQVEAMRFLTDFEKLVPGAVAAAATEASGLLRLHLEPWPNNPLANGSYTCYRPGEFTTIAGLEGQAAGNLHFAGEHTNSFYEWQGFMEGACISGMAAAQAVLR